MIKENTVIQLLVVKYSVTVTLENFVTESCRISVLQPIFTSLTDISSYHLLCMICLQPNIPMNFVLFGRTGCPLEMCPISNPLIVNMKVLKKIRCAQLPLKVYSGIKLGPSALKIQTRVLRDLSILPQAQPMFIDLNITVSYHFFSRAPCIPQTVL